MRLPSPTFLKKKGEEHYYLALLLRDETVTAVIFEEQDQKIRMVTSHEEKFTTSIEHADIEEWLDVFDKAVSIAESKVQAETNLEQTIFGVKETWIHEGKIKKDYLTRLKKVCEELSLEPIGFLVFSEAVAHLLQQQEGTPISAIFAEVGAQLVTVSLIKGGKVVESKSAKLETFNAAQIVDSLLRHFAGYEVFPPRIIVQNDDSEISREEMNRLFGKHNWSKSLPFLHVPEVSILPKPFAAEAILSGAATQMGFTLADISQLPHIIKKESVEETAQEEKLAQTPPEHQEGDNFTPVATQDFGFVQDQDLAENEKEEPHEPIINDHHPDEKELAALEDDEVAENKRLSLPLQSFMLGGIVRSFFAKLPVGKTFSSLPLAAKGGKLIFIIPAVVILLIIGIVFYYLSVKTTVSLAIHPDIVSTTQTITFTTNGDNDFSSNVIAAEAVSVTENGNAQTNTTGKKDIGDKAKGTVTIYNGDDSSKTFSAATTITSDKGVKFTLDKDVTVASASGDVISGTKSGTAQVSVTAADIGTDYNLPSGTTFTVEGQSSTLVKAKNDNAFSGGSKKTVSVVSKDDVAKLTSELVKNIQGKAKDDVSKKLSSNQELISDISAGDISDKKTDKNVGDQATSITMTGNVSFEALAYKKDDMNAFAKKLLAGKISNAQTLDENNITVTVNNPKTQKNGDVSASTDIVAKVMPKIDNKQVAESIKGSSFDDAQAKVAKLPQVSGSTITLSPSLPLLPKRISIKSSNITIVTHNE